jgi:Zn-dependent M28 family amino/carboxypeptidase
VAGVIKGEERPDEHVLLMAHWDHLGKNGPSGDGLDGIFNGAVDNATGVASILEIAEKAAAGPKPARSMTFLAVTLEESGLLGSAYFADRPLIPLNKIVGGINLDALQPMGPTKDVIVIGAGASQLEDLLREELAKTSRVIRPDPQPEAGYFYRSDHISLSKKGVPMLYIDNGIDLVDGGEARGKAIGEVYRTRDYHAPSDEFHDNWDFSGMEADIKVDYEVANRLANDTRLWPQWFEGNEFRAVREASLAAQ